ncbi:MAG: glycosyltransferase, partial [Acidimicrobiia bacterium]
MLTVQEAAEMTGRHPETIRRWIRAGKLPARKVGLRFVVEQADLPVDLPPDLPAAWQTTATACPTWLGPCVLLGSAAKPGRRRSRPLYRSAGPPETVSTPAWQTDPVTRLLAPDNDYRQLIDRPPADPSLTACVVIPVYNRVELLARTVAGLVAQSYPRDLLSVVVADDGSQEDVAAAVEPFRGRLSLQVVRREHQGYGAGQARNLGARSTQADVLVFIDADCLPDPELVTRHLEWHQRADNLVVVGSRHDLDTGGLDPKGLAEGSVDLHSRAFGRADLPAEELVPPDMRKVLYRRTTRLRRGDEAFRSLVSSNFSLRRDRLWEVGGFEEEFRRWGGEDTELGWRL